MTKGRSFKINLIEEIIKELPKVDSNINYWLVRTNGGEYYEEFVNENFIGIGWNKITRERIKDNISIEDLVRENYKKESRPRYVETQILRFIEGIKKGDVVLVPSKNSRYLHCGYVISDDYYEADLPINDESAFEQLFELEEEGICPYRKRKWVKWIKPLSKDQLDPKLYLLVYSHHTITSANDYKDLINRAMFDMYIQDEKCYATFQIERAENIEARSLVTFLNSLIEVNKIKSGKDDLEIKISVQSPGLTEIIDNLYNIVWTCVVILSIIGGKVKTPFFQFESGGVVGYIEKYIKERKNEGKVPDNIREDLKSSSEELKMTQPSEFVKAIEKVQKKEKVKEFENTGEQEEKND
ncbi:hypothetical protein ACE1TI_13405 [Alteribacillus sp. JSM 102045]|uniref:hypothetical protein n=1 Tax=Alteribacillus sp. JSM 102045 TaxID=1562101 RepID=UPI0035C1A61E